MSLSVDFHHSARVGEAPMIPPLAAVANAVYQATGVRMDQLPLSPSTVLEALQARR
jgi:CO/xanthine dehydrogenase Mo-binding subunit